MEEIHFAPLQGYTDIAYCNAHFQNIGSINYYYTPFFSIDDRLFLDIKNVQKELLPLIIPQILPGNLDELKVLLKFVLANQFHTININLGCPYPMVTRKGRGAGLIQNPTLVSDMIQYINEHSKLSISLKTRLGLIDETSIYKLLEKINPDKVGAVTIHPRTAKQLYKGNASSEMFLNCIQRFPQFNFIYNGDINSFEDFRKLKDYFQGQEKWMLGRGLLSNPLLGCQIKSNSPNLSIDYSMKLNDFVFHLIENIERDSKDMGHALNRIRSQFGYLSNSFPDHQRVFKKILKIKTLKEVKELLYRELFD